MLVSRAMRGVLLGTVLLGLLLVGCGEPSVTVGETVVSAGEPVMTSTSAAGEVPTTTLDVGDAEPTVTTIPLPWLPSHEELFPELYDEDGCPVDTPRPPGVLCFAPPLLLEPPTDPDGWKRLEGFEGPFYNGLLESGRVVVLADHVAFGSGASFSALGLIRNESREPVGSVVVSASLLAGDGSVIEVVSSKVVVDPIRPGEPAPFEIVSGVPTEKVAEVVWDVVAGPPNGLSRAVEVIFGLELPSGDRKPYNGLGYAESGGPPYPYVWYASVDHLGDPVPLPRITALWLDRSGRPLVLVSDAVRDGVTGAPMPVLKPTQVEGGRGDIWLVVPDSTYRSLLGSGYGVPMIWVYGS